MKSEHLELFYDFFHRKFPSPLSNLQRFQRNLIALLVVWGTSFPFDRFGLDCHSSSEFSYILAPSISLGFTW